MFGAFGIGNLYGVYGEAEGKPQGNTAAVGVMGEDGTGYSNAGVEGYSLSGVGGFFTAPTALLAIAEPSGSSTSAVAIDARSQSFPLSAANTSTNPSYYVELSTPTDLIDAQNNGEKFYVTTAGNAYLSGTIMTAGGTYARKGNSGTTRVAYGAQMTAPEIEDVGEGNLVNGRGVVVIDPALADTIDMRHAYHVFITPEGDSNQLYVTQKTPGSFVVREAHGGRSTIAFDYRIVAKPRDENGDRLALAPAQPEHPHPPIVTASSGKRTSRFLSPEARLKQRLGPEGYATAIAELGRRIAGK
jgi:hypothetical protein